jgi:hypothetical protein
VLFNVTNITYVIEKRKHDRESRVTTILEDRKDCGKFGQRFKDSN